MDYDDKMLWFNTDTIKTSFLERLKTYFKIKLDKNKFIFGENMNYFEVLLNKRQILDLIEVLKNEGYTPLETDIVTKNIDEYTTSLFDVNGILFGVEKDISSFVIATHLLYEDDIWAFTTGKNCAALEEKEVNNFLYILQETVKE